MALRNQPYFPLYVQDYLTDEKLNLCSWETQGIYIKILCILHKQKEYGCILLKQNPKQNESISFYFADILVRNIPCRFEDMVSAIDELLENDVLTLDGNKLLQSRMVKDNSISQARSDAGKKGGGNPNLLKQNTKQKHKQKAKQNTEDENEDVIDNINKGKNEKKEIVFPFDSENFKTQWQVWKDYKRKEFEFKFKSIGSEQANLTQLSNLAKDEKEAVAIIHQSMANGWKGFFNLKTETHGQQINQNGAGRKFNFTPEQLGLDK